jgi:8-oxo-dGTP pyrophosphatase MutT (NUDIX family)
VRPEFEDVRGALCAGTPTLHDPGPDGGFAAVALLLAPAAGGEPEVLLIRRAQRAGDPWSGHLGLPGGRRQAGDADLLGTALRETFEEVGVRLDARAFLGQLDDLRPTTRVLPRLVVRPFAFGLAARPALTLNHEVEEPLWTPLSVLRGARVRARVVARGEELEVDSLPVSGHVLWGMTLRILDGFLARTEGR